MSCSASNAPDVCHFARSLTLRQATNDEHEGGTSPHCAWINLRPPAYMLYATQLSKVEAMHCQYVCYSLEVLEEGLASWPL